MKLSMYNFRKNINDDVLLFNSRTGALAIINDEVVKIMDDIESGVFDENKYDKSLLENMEKFGCILPDDFDEIRLIEYIRNMQKYQKTSLSLTILPTLECNFRCTYCFEDHLKGKMSLENQRYLINFVKHRIKDIKKLHVTWFGGEPMLYKDIVYNLSKELIDLCNRNNVAFSSSMVSNGSLIEKEDIQFFKKYHINGIQFTIDGPKEVHEKRRISVSKEGSFEKILDVTNLCQENDINVSLRINIDKENLNRIDELLGTLKNKIIKYKQINISFGKITTYTESCRSVEAHCLDCDEFEKHRLGLYSKLMKYGFEKCKMMAYPKVKFNNCGADLINSFVIDFNGYIYKCWNQAGRKDENCGHIKEGVKSTSYNYLGWIQWSPVQVEKCSECKILPLCMGGCPSNGGEPFLVSKGTKKNYVCDGIKENMEEMMVYYYRLLKKA